MDFEPLDVLKEQYVKQRSYLVRHASGLPDRPRLLECLKLTRDMIDLHYHLQYNDKTGKWEVTRKPRLRPLQKGKPVELWVIGPTTTDRTCTRFANEMYNQGEGPVPIRDTHPHCVCRREIVAIPGDRGGLKWAITRPKNTRQPKLKRTPKAYRKPIDPYDVDSIRSPDAVFA